jgi:membrane protein implicated in regulation of membrane protease activity
MPDTHRRSAAYTVRLLPARSWLAYLLLVPFFALAVLLAVFFFAAFLAFLAVAALVIGVRLWWLRRRLRRARRDHAIEGEYVVIRGERTAVEADRRGDDGSRNPLRGSINMKIKVLNHGEHGE